MCALCRTGAVASAANFECSVVAGADAATSQLQPGAGAGELQAPGSIYSYQQIADYLRLGYWGVEDHQWIDMDGGGSGTNITYNIDGLTAAGQQLALSALQAWQDVCDVTFVRTSAAAELSFDDTYGGAFTGWTFGGSDGTYIVGSYINVGTSWLDSYGSGFDSYSYLTYIHEIGHALGLGHAGPYNGGGTYNANAIYANDTWQYSVMSYWQQSNFGGASTRYVMTPEIADILAVQIQYGAATSTRTGNTVYGFNATAGGIFNFAAYASAPALTIYDNGGNDTVDCSGYTANQVIDLRAGSYSSVGGLVNNIGIALNAVIENAVGGSGSDVITASGADGGWMCGLDGDDTIIAYGGNMQLAYGDGGQDQLFFIGNQNQLFGGAGTDWLGVSGDNNTLIGADGDEWMGASGIGNTVVGGEGHDSLFAYGTGNGLHGEAGNDWLGVSGNGNTLAGGAGFDWIGASGTGNTLTGGEDGDTLISFGSNSLDGGNGDDWVGCSGNGNTLKGGAGDDYLAASGDDNLLDGGQGDDILLVAAHSDDRFVFHFGYGHDTVQGFSTAAGDVVDMEGFGLSFAALQSTMSQVGNDVVIALDTGHSLTLRNVQLGTLSAGDFDLA